MWVRELAESGEGAMERSKKKGWRIDYGGRRVYKASSKAGGTVLQVVGSRKMENVKGSVGRPGRAVGKRSKISVLWKASGELQKAGSGVSSSSKHIECEESCGESKDESHSENPLPQKSTTRIPRSYEDALIAGGIKNVMILESTRRGSKYEGGRHKYKGKASSSSCSANREEEEREDKRINLMGPCTHPRMTVHRVRKILAEVTGRWSSKMASEADMEHVAAATKSYFNLDRKVICYRPTTKEDDNEDFIPANCSIVCQAAKKSKTQVLQLKNPSKNSLLQRMKDHPTWKGKSKRRRNTVEKKERSCTVSAADEDALLSQSSASKSAHKRQRYENAGLSVKEDTCIALESWRARTSLKLYDDLEESPGHQQVLKSNLAENIPGQSGSCCRPSVECRTFCHTVRKGEGRFKKVVSQLQTCTAAAAAADEEVAEPIGIVGTAGYKEAIVGLDDDALSMTTSESASQDANRAWRRNLKKDINEHSHSCDKQGSDAYCGSDAREVITKNAFMINKDSHRQSCSSRVQRLLHAFTAKKARTSNAIPKKEKLVVAAAELPMLTNDICPGGKDRLEDWDPPMSPLGLIQECVEIRQDAWKVLLTSMLVHKATGRSVDKIIWDLFELCPNAESAVHMETGKIADIVYSLGLQNKRAKMIQRFSSDYLRGDWMNVGELHGIGKYATDSYAIFYQGLWRQVQPEDPTLTSYWNWIQQLYGLHSS